MDELNVYALLQQAREVAIGSGADIFGVEIAIVTNVKDPDKLGRVKVCFPRLPGKPESDWARMAHPGAGSGRGLYWIPQVNDEVLVAFERGQANRPYVIGCLWNGQDKPMAGAYADQNTVEMIQTRSGHQIVLDDTAGAEKIVIADKSGKRVLTFDVKGNKFLVEASEGDVEVHAAKKIVFDCEDLEIKTRKAARVEIGTRFDLKVIGKGQIKAGPLLVLKATRVDINPGGSGGGGAASAGLAAAAAARGIASSAKSGSNAARAGGAGASPASAGGGPRGDLSAEVVPAQGRGAAPSSATPGVSEEPRAGGAGSVPGPGGGAATAPAGSSATAAPGAAADTDIVDGLEIQLVNAAGAPQAGLEVEVTLPGAEKRAGKTDASGTLKLSGLSQTGNAHIEVPAVQVAEPVTPADPARVGYAVGGVDVPIRRRTSIELPPRVRRCRMRGLHFETDKAFLLPTAMTGIRQLVKLFKSFEGLVALVNGHTDMQAADKPGGAEYNRRLSLDRADSIKSFLLDNARGWERFYSAKTPQMQRWGTREDQHMLATIKDGSGTLFYSGSIDGLKGPLTSAAYRDFQRSRLISETGAPDAETRLELSRAYMQLEGTSLPGAPVETHGCGFTHPTPETEGDPALAPEQRARLRADQPVNRRVEVFLFEGKVDPPPCSPCPGQGCREYETWVGHKVLDVDLDQPPGSLRVKVIDESGAPLSAARVHAAGPLLLDGVGPEAAFEDLVPGSYKVVVSCEQFLAADAVVEVPSGGVGEKTLTLQEMLYELKVVVKDRATPQKPLPGATVSVSAPGVAPQTTDANGRATFPHLHRGRVHVTASCEGYQPAEGDTRLPAGPALETRSSLAGEGGPGGQGHPEPEFGLELDAAVKAVFIVRDPVGAPIRNAKVVLWPTGSAGSPVVKATDDQGRAEFDTTSGRHRIQVVAEHFVDADKNLPLSGPNQMIPWTAEMPPPQIKHAFAWQNRALRAAWYDHRSPQHPKQAGREFALRQFLTITRKLDPGGKAVDPSEFDALDHNALLKQTLERLKAMPQQLTDEPWLKYGVLHFSGLRYASAHESYADPLELHSLFRAGRLPTETRQRIPGELFAEITKDTPHLDDLVDEAKLDDPSSAKKFETAKDDAARAAICLDVRRAKTLKQASALSEEQARWLLTKRLLSGNIPTLVWRFIRSKTLMRNDVASAAEVELSQAEIAEVLADKTSGPALRNWTSDGTRWRARHAKDLEIVVTRAVCDQIAEMLQQCRGINLGGKGLTGNALAATELTRPQSLGEVEPGMSIFFAEWKDLEFDKNGKILDQKVAWNAVAKDTKMEFRLGNEEDDVLTAEQVAEIPDLDSLPAGNEGPQRFWLRIATLRILVRKSDSKWQFLNWKHQATIAGMAPPNVIYTFETFEPTRLASRTLGSRWNELYGKHPADEQKMKKMKDVIARYLRDDLLLASDDG